ncbi:hypothetical protein WA026_015995 [Henosepilachna vigintioctopunctata]|uniref:YEATS domain-containing protein 4 n=1 Tax=Henosepilachna vigintioctopunctata TaxID=420089 RepID=A0AAW1U8M2_9CUCU
MSLLTDFGPDSGGRIKGVCIIKPIVYGNIARYFGKKREEDGHTHQWTVYVKPYNNEDMSSYIKKVHFKLHESYANQNRIVVKPPYEISETGWGEFEIVIKIHFHDPNERPVTMYHILKLFHSGGTTDLGMEAGKGLVSESYDEIVFQDPTQFMHHLLTNTKQLTLGRWEHNTNCENLFVIFFNKAKQIPLLTYIYIMLLNLHPSIFLAMSRCTKLGSPNDVLRNA